MNPLDENRNRFESGEAVGEALTGDFEKLAARCRAGQNLTERELNFIADLLTGNTAFKIAWKDGRKRRQPDADEKQFKLAHLVFWYLHKGNAPEMACTLAMEEIYPDRDPRPATARAAYNKWRHAFRFQDTPEPPVLRSKS